MCPYATEKWLNCDECPLIDLEEAMVTPAGRTVSRAIQLDMDINSHIAPNLDEITARVYAAMKTLRAEQSIHEAELRKKK
jgi:hypothetical protein